MAEEMNYLIRCDAPTSEFLVPEMRQITGTEPRLSEVKGIGGSTEVIVFGTAVVSAIAAVLDLITKAIVAGRTIRGIKIADSEHNNPKKSDIEELRKRICGDHD